MAYDTYICCVSEHDAREDTVGRLSMWRAYSECLGRRAGAAERTADRAGQRPPGRDQRPGDLCRERRSFFRAVRRIRRRGCCGRRSMSRGSASRRPAAGWSATTPSRGALGTTCGLFRGAGVADGVHAVAAADRRSGARGRVVPQRAAGRSTSCRWWRGRGRRAGAGGAQRLRRGGDHRAECQAPRAVRDAFVDLLQAAGVANAAAMVRISDIPDPLRPAITRRSRRFWRGRGLRCGRGRG